MQLSKKLIIATAILSTAILAGCASSSSTKAKGLKATTSGATSLSECENITVFAFGVPSKGKADASTGSNFAHDIENRLVSDFGPIFKSVEYGDKARGLENECLVTGNITKYKPGSRVARAILIGLGAASLEGNVKVVDAGSQKELLNAPFSKLWAWGGIVGASKGIDDMVKESSAAVAATLAQAKGWTAPAK
jgi:curli biogenesis system outer membrane secretion channel CsgG